MTKTVNKNANNSIWRFNQNGKNKNTYLNSKFRYGFFNHCSKELSPDTLPCLYVLIDFISGMSDSYAEEICKMIE